MDYVRLPLSGNVSQDISPFRNSVFNLFTVNMGRSAAPEAEEAILEVASYGRQLGRMGEALLAVIESDPDRKLNDVQKAAIEDFRVMLREIARVKKEAMERPAPHSLWRGLLPWWPNGRT
jgi:Ser/Thr protein kinase RdoA (MazF antagonist)